MLRLPDIIRRRHTCDFSRARTTSRTEQRRIAPNLTSVVVGVRSGQTCDARAVPDARDGGRRRHGFGRDGRFRLMPLRDPLVPQRVGQHSLRVHLRDVHRFHHRRDARGSRARVAEPRGGGGGAQGEGTRQEGFRRRKASSPPHPQEVLSTALMHLPKWTKDPDCNRAAWLNNVLEVLWPHVDTSVSEVIRDSLEPSCAPSSRPSSLGSGSRRSPWVPPAHHRRRQGARQQQRGGDARARGEPRVRRRRRPRRIHLRRPRSRAPARHPTRAHVRVTFTRSPTNSRASEDSRSASWAFPSTPTSASPSPQAST